MQREPGFLGLAYFLVRGSGAGKRQVHFFAENRGGVGVHPVLGHGGQSECFRPLLGKALEQAVHGGMHGVGAGMRHYAYPVAECGVQGIRVAECRTEVATFPEASHNEVAAWLERHHGVGRNGIGEKIARSGGCLRRGPRQQRYGQHDGTEDMSHKLAFDMWERIIPQN